MGIGSKVACARVCRDWYDWIDDYTEWNHEQYLLSIKYKIKYFIDTKYMNITDDIIKYAIRECDDSNIILALFKRHTPTFNALIEAVQYSREPVVKYIIMNNLAVHGHVINALFYLVTSYRNKMLSMLPVLLEYPNLDLSSNEFIFEIAMAYDHVEAIRLLIVHKSVNPRFDNSRLLRYAARANHIDLLRDLLKYPNVHVYEAIIAAIENKHAHAAEILLGDPRADWTINNNILLDFAVKNSLMPIIKLLLQNPQLDLHKSGNEILIAAIDNADATAVKLLLDKMTSVGDDVVKAAFSTNYSYIIKLILNHPMIDLTTPNNQATIEHARAHGSDTIKHLLACTVDPDTDFLLDM